MALVSGWIVFWNPASLASFERNAPRIDEAMPEWIRVDESGRPYRVTEYPAKRKRFREIARRHRVRVYAMASNYGTTDFDPLRMTKLLATPSSRKLAIDAMRRIVREDGLPAIDLDFESLAETDRDRFSLFVEGLAKGLHRDGRTLSVTLHPKLDDDGGWHGPKAQDVRRIGRVADAVRVMAYDQHGPWSEEGAVSELGWTERVMRYFLTRVPARKLDLGTPWYGYDFATKPVASLTWPDRDWTNATIDPLSGELIKERAHFGGVESFRRRRELVGRLGLRGTSAWYIGSEDPAVWSLAPLRSR